MLNLFNYGMAKRQGYFAFIIFSFKGNDRLSNSYAKLAVEKKIPVEIVSF